MNANIKINGLKKISGEPIGNIVVKSSKLKPINCPKNLVPFAIDEFPLSFTSGLFFANQVSSIDPLEPNQPHQNQHD